MSATASHAHGQGLSSGFQSPESARFKGSEPIEKFRNSNLAKEPNPFEQSFSKSALVTEDSETPSSKPTLPSISLLSQGARFFKDDSVKLSPIILDPATYKTQPQTHHSFQNPVHPPMSNPASTLSLPPASNSALPQFSTAPPYPHPLANQQTPHMMPHPYSKSHGYIAAGPMDPVSLLGNNGNLLHLHPYSNSPVPHPGFKGHLPMIPSSLYSIPTSPKQKRSAGGRKRLPTDGMSAKKIDFLERNRKAALKCRQRKKDEFRRVEESIKLLNLNNNMLTGEIQMIGQEAMKLRGLLISHSSCPVAQKAGILGEATLPLPTQMILPFPFNDPRL